MSLLVSEEVEGLFDGEKRPTYIERIKTFDEDHPDYSTKKEYFSSSKAKAISQAENFEKWGFRAILVIDDSTHLAAFLGVDCVATFLLFPPP